MTTIITKIRNLIEDWSTSTQDIFTYEASSIFTLTESNPISITIVYINGVSTSSYSYSSTTKKLTISASLSSGDTIQIDYTAYLNYSDTEIQGYINSAIYYLGMHNFEHYEVESGNNIYPIPTSREEQLIAMIAALLINKPVSNYRLPNISINIPEKDSLDTKIGKTISSFKRSREGEFTVL